MVLGQSGRAVSSWPVPPALPGLAPGLVATGGGPAGPERALGRAQGDVLAGESPAAQQSLSQWLWVRSQMYKSLWEEKGPTALRSQCLCDLLVSMAGAGGHLEQVTAEGWSEVLSGVLQPSPVLGHSGKMLWGWVWLFAAD